MAETPSLTREERLAAKLRENLRRRKAQARAVSDALPAGESPETAGEICPALPKAGTKS